MNDNDEGAETGALVAHIVPRIARPVMISFTGTGDRHVRIGYVVETPVWKTSYRLVLGPANSKNAYLQGWAIVENQTESDWKQRVAVAGERATDLLHDGSLPATLRDAIGKAIELKQAVLDVEQQMTTRSQEINEITGEQARIRENMKTVSPSTSYYSRLLAKLNDQESTIERLQTERAALVTKRDGLRKDLEAYLQGLSVG